MENVPVTPPPPPQEKKKTGAVVGTIVAAVLCGCPGLIAMCWGAISAIVSFIPDANIDIGGSSDPNTAFFVGLGSLCGGVIFIAIPIVVGVLTLRKKKDKTVDGLPPIEPIPGEPLPPAS